MRRLALIALVVACKHSSASSSSSSSSASSTTDTTKSVDVTQETRSSSGAWSVETWQFDPPPAGVGVVAPPAKPAVQGKAPTVPVPRNMPPVAVGPLRSYTDEKDAPSSSTTDTQAKGQGTTETHAQAKADTASAKSTKTAPAASCAFSGALWALAVLVGLAGLAYFAWKRRAI